MPAASKSPSRKRKARKKEPALSRTHKPQELSLEQWQIGLRRQFGKAQKFKVKPLGDEPIFGDYLVTNPETNRTYRVCIRGSGCGDNHCSCIDFSINTLGTCKHIEFLIARLLRKSGAKAVFKRQFRPPFSELHLRYGADRQAIVRFGVDADPAIVQQSRKFLDENGVLRPEAYARFDELLGVLRSGGHEVRVDEDVLEFIAQARDRQRLPHLIDELFPKGLEDAAWDTLLKASLYPYQRRGALFLARAGRALLADDMGLGKTIQSLAAAEILSRAAGVERVLIVTPTSLKHQWKREIEAFTDRSALVIGGGPRSRRALYGSEAFYKIANYETLHLDAEKIAKWSPDLIILDEAQRIKNWKTRTAQAVKRLPSQHAIVLSGTPLENRLEELHSIVEFVDRYRLGPTFRFLAEHQQLNEDGRVVGYRNLSTIAKTLEPVLLRRTKAEVLGQLPDRVDQQLFLPLTPQQREIHEEYRQIVARLVQRWRSKRYLSEADQRRLTCALQNMRMACNSTYLLDPATNFGTKVDEIMSRLDDLLASDGQKVVIFSQWVRSHELLREQFDKRRIGHVLLHGGVPGHKRGDLINRFRDESRCRVFLSTDAGGVGLNLQNASAVYIMDQPWNPAVLEQRIGRVHRLGQTNKVQVLHFIARDSIEEGMLDLIKFKRSLFAGVLDGAADDVFLGGTRLNQFMNGVEAATSKVSSGHVSAPDPSDEVASQKPVVGPVTGETTPAESNDSSDGYAQTLSSLVSLGQSLLNQLATALSPAKASSERGASSARWRIHSDAETGEPCIQIPMPKPEDLGKLNLILRALTAATELPQATAQPVESADR